MPRQPRAVETRQKIIDAAVELFAEKGYAETGLNDLTARAGVTTGAFYYHFTSKEALATAIMDQGWPRLSTSSPAASSPRHRALRTSS